MLATDSFGVMELCQLFDIKQSGMSHHLKVLATAGLVASRREGNSIFYRRNHSSLEDTSASLTVALYQTLDGLPITASLQQRIDQIHNQRAEASQAFFAEQTDTFKEKQDLIAAYQVYGPQILELLATTALPASQRVLEIGPGAGEMLPQLAQQFAQVVALDNADSMLRNARQLCQQQQLDNLVFVCNDTRYCQSQQQSFDCAVINMVLHHTPSPAQIFADVSQCLKPGGAFLVCELCEHNQDWAREACGDVWLGFEPQDLSRWAAENAMREGQSIYVALRNGFQIQLRQFFKL